MSCSYYTDENTLREQPDWEELGGIKGAVYRLDDALFCVLLNKSPIVIKLRLYFKLEPSGTNADGLTPKIRSKKKFCQIFTMSLNYAFHQMLYYLRGKTVKWDDKIHL